MIRRMMTGCMVCIVSLETLESHVRVLAATVLGDRISTDL